ncbi:phosphoenolpyruvate synthase [Mucilaginibacter sp. PPCGB 2223]|uniref:phosphoenolpyruvate synthase n=1 Tax=Mucilaginibacter sp. PPCGB 2223 TaxID=1886027 RepID=UPI0008258A7D|nr:phosphoenolpyruvate synthase [Mucilaginibacter sp. PPCGB 2223]OCX53476.1 phosphoenolpyruvate synthase [Mucilaginibacter sp. PPCGB 2223]
MKNTKFILNLNEVGIDNIDIVGGKNASLGEMLQHLTKLNVRIPGGYIITVAAYQEYISYNLLEDQIKSLIHATDLNDLDALRRCGQKVRRMIAAGVFPPALTEQITHAYHELSAEYSVDNVDVAVRSSATAEDLPDASFAGQQETFLNVSGVDALLDSVRDCFASLFTDRAISYRESFNYDHFDIGLSVCVQKMVRSDLAASGVAFSLDTESGFKDAVIINGSYGLGELIVQGSVSPDEFMVFKPTLKQGFDSIIERKLGVKDKKMVYSKVIGERVTITETSQAEFNSFCLSDVMVLQLAQWVITIEEHYSRIKNRWCPMDIEWAIDGQTGQLFIVQARPETIHSRKQYNTLTGYSITDANRTGHLLLKGIAVGDKIAAGKVNILEAHSKDEISHIDFKKGDVLVTDMTDPDWEPIMKIASAIITNKGGRTCHAAIVARELGVPAIVGCGNATKILKQEQLITASCAEGDTGLIYNGAISFKETTYNLDELPETKTPVMLNVASPDMAFNFSHYPNKGVGLAREEFIINNYIQVHPMALMHHRELNDVDLSAQIDNLTRGFKDEEDFFVQKLACGIARIASAFYPNKVIVRFSDFKSNEYYNLLGGKYFEPTEENPMIGWRGASRYYSSEYKEAFGLECRAIKLVREKLGLKNVVVMIPFCRTVKELLQVYEVMAEYGLNRGEDGLEIFLMAELPSNVIMADQFAKHIDGFSIGSNDLTQLVLGLDRDSSLVAHIYDERNEAVKSMIKMLIKTAKQSNIKVGICGQGPSDFPDFAQFLVEQGIDTISVTPDSFFKTVNAISQIEQGLKTEKVTLDSAA